MRDAPSLHRCLSHWNGSWVHHGAQQPPYLEQASAAARTNQQSVNVRQSPMCKRQQSWKWRWESSDVQCPFHHPTQHELCERLRGRRIILYGDSLTQQFFVSLASLTGRAAQATPPPGCEHMRHLECVRLCDDDQDTEGGPVGVELPLVCQRIKFGMALDESPATPENCTVRPSTVSPLRETFPSSCLRGFDVVIISTVAHWVGSDGALRLAECLASRRSADAGRAAANADASAYVAALFKQQMQRDATHLRQTLALVASSGDGASWRPSTRVFFRTSPTGYPSPVLLHPDTLDGAPPVFTAPSRDVEWARSLAARNASRFNHHLFSRFNAIASHAYKSAGLDVLDVEAPMLHRVDGHLDLLHYCLPGPVDFYSEALWNYVLPRSQTSHKRKDQ